MPTPLSGLPWMVLELQGFFGPAMPSAFKRFAIALGELPATKSLKIRTTTAACSGMIANPPGSPRSSGMARHMNAVFR